MRRIREFDGRPRGMPEGTEKGGLLERYFKVYEKHGDLMAK